MLPNEVFALECLARYAREGLDVREGGVHDGHQDQFAHCPKPRPKGQKGRRAGDLGYWLTFYDHQKQGLLQSVDEGRMCYWIPDVRKYLDTWPPGCFELWDIYDKFNKATEERKEKVSRALSGRTGTLCPMYGRYGALHNGSKAVKVIKPDGSEEYFGGIDEAARELKTHRGNVYQFLKGGHVIKQGKFKGCQFLYDVEE